MTVMAASASRAAAKIVDTAALDAWISKPPLRSYTHNIDPHHLARLSHTLPGGSSKLGLKATTLAEGYTLALLNEHELVDTEELEEDGTSNAYSPPEPFSRRMWVGGRFEWNYAPRLTDKLSVHQTVSKVEKKSFYSSNPMLFVTQRLEVTTPSSPDPALIEERAHVYMLPSKSSSSRSRPPRDVNPHPSTASTHTSAFFASPELLFRFSALTFNAHKIHLDKTWATEVEGYAERLVHAPLTALLLVRLAADKKSKSGSRLRRFDYRATNPLTAGQEITLNMENNNDGNGDEKSVLWAVDERGVVGMTGNASYVPA